MCPIIKENILRFLVSLLLCIAFGNVGVVYAISDGHELLNSCKAMEEKTDYEAEKVLDKARELVESGNTDKVTINDLNELLSSANALRAASCVGFLSGFGGANALSPLKHKGKRMFCVPKEVTINQMAAMAVSWMEENEDKLQFGAHEVLAMSSIVNFPCPAI